MREVVFRGKPKDETQYYFFSQIWKDNCVDGFACGSLVVDKGRCFIAVSALCSIKSCINNGMISMIEVIPETVGQYIGQNDKNHKKVFEGDILYHKPKYSLRTEKYYIFSEDSSFYYRDPTKEYGTPIDDSEFGLNVSHYKVIGNVHNNPEMLNKEAKE